MTPWDKQYQRHGETCCYWYYTSFHIEHMISIEVGGQNHPFWDKLTDPSYNDQKKYKHNRT